MSDELVLVTGGSGFIGAHCILRLLHEGYHVRTTVRAHGREADVRAQLEQGGATSEQAASVEFVAADLLSDEGWPQAVDSATYVLHVASPFPEIQPKDENELIVPAREGALRVLRAARDGGIARVVQTSSFAAIGHGRPPAGRPFTEEDWTDPNAPGVQPYAKSKTLAERAAWDFVHRGALPELAVVNPVGVLGPVLGPDMSSSIRLVKALMDGQTSRGAPRLSFNVVDVRDVADLHVRAMTDPAAGGERFLAVADGPVSMKDVADVLRRRMGTAASRVPTRVLPDWQLRLAALFSRQVRDIVPDLGVVRAASNEKARRLLGWEPRSNEEAIVATAESLVRLGLVQDSKRVA